MAVTGYWYPNGLKNCFTSGTPDVDWVGDSASIYCALMNSDFQGVSQSLSLADYWNDISSRHVVTATGYTMKTVGTTTVAVTGTSNKTIKFSGTASTVWTTATLTARGAVVFKSVAQASDSPVLFFLDFGADVQANSGDFTITWHTDGMATVVCA